MTIEVLIQAIVRQTTVLIAQLATSWGSRAPWPRWRARCFSTWCPNSKPKA